MAAPRSLRTDIFSRRLTDDGRYIESCCKFCGTVIIGSVMEGLLEKEQEHVKACPKCPKVPRE